MSDLRLGFVTGLEAEARIARRCGGLVRVGGGTPEGAERAAQALAAEGAQALVSFGLAGGLEPALRPGDLIVPSEVVHGETIYATDPAISARFGGPTPHRLLAAETVVVTASAKRKAAAASGAQVVDLESGAVAQVAAEHRLPFAVVRAICDPAERDLPPAALVALDAAGAIGLLRVIGSLLRRPAQLRALLTLARDASRARGTLLAVSGRVARDR